MQKIVASIKPVGEPSANLPHKNYSLLGKHLQSKKKFGCDDSTVYDHKKAKSSSYDEEKGVLYLLVNSLILSSDWKLVYVII